jgi:lipoate-protein ligase A
MPTDANPAEVSRIRRGLPRRVGPLRLGLVAVPFEILPARTASAAENMAVDFLLLQRCPAPPAVRFRHYGWRRPAFTFGYSQKIAAVRSMLPPGGTQELCRRPTGGGLVDHRDDWTYTLVAPRGHLLEEMRASESYRAVHESLVTALRRQGIEARLQEPQATGSSGIAGSCFVRAEPFDVVRAVDGAKIAGAAQKRSKRGLLLQGSIWKPAASGTVDWDLFLGDFVKALAPLAGSPARDAPFPELEESELAGLAEQYASPEWIEAR